MYSNSKVKDIKRIVSSLSTWKTTGIEPSRHGQDDKNVQLDVLARILTWPKDVCIALCLWNKKLLVASNKELPESAKENLKKWQKFIEIPSPEKELELLRIALEKSYKVMEKNDLGNIMREQFFTSEEKESLRKFNELSDRKRRTADKKGIDELVERLFVISKNLKSRKLLSLANKIWDFISPIDDSNKMMKFILERKLDESLLNSISNFNICFIESEENIHAEMKVIDYIFDHTPLEEQEEKEYVCIGIGKFCCLPCQKAIDVINEFGRCRIGVPGTHGKAYPNWSLLKSFLNGNCNNEYERFKEELRRISEAKFSPCVRESTCCFPERLTCFGFEQLVAQQEWLPK